MEVQWKLNWKMKQKGKWKWNKKFTRTWKAKETGREPEAGIQQPTVTDRPKSRVQKRNASTTPHVPVRQKTGYPSQPRTASQVLPNALPPSRVPPLLPLAHHQHPPTAAVAVAVTTTATPTAVTAPTTAAMEAEGHR